jgi:hypothetical protein
MRHAATPTSTASLLRGVTRAAKKISAFLFDPDRTRQRGAPKFVRNFVRIFVRIFFEICLKFV